MKDCDGEWEYVVTRDGVNEAIGSMYFYPKRPDGYGWEIYDANKEHATWWRRPRQPE